MKTPVCTLIKRLPFALLLVATLRGAEPWEADRLFWLNMDWTDNPRSGQDKTENITAEAKGAGQGKRLSTDTWAVKETRQGQAMAPTGVVVYPLSCKFLPTGAANQAVEWPAAENVQPTGGAMSFFVQGDKWDAANAHRETLLALDGKGGSLSIEKNKPNTLAAVVNGAAVIETLLEAPDRYHHVVVNFEADPGARTGQVSLHVDRKLAGVKKGVALPAAYDRIVVGQMGPGPDTNKVLDNIAIYRRPLTQGEITKIYYLEGKIELLKVVTVPWAPQPIKIDGLFDPGEWDAAAGVCGFVDESVWDSYVYYAGSGKPWAVADTVRLAYDDQRLYFAYHCPPPEVIKGNVPMIVAMLKETKPGFDSDVDSDDSFFIDIHRPYPWGDMYHLIVNGLNTHYEFSDGGVAPGSVEKKRDLQFNPKWTTATTLTTEGWKLEGAIPWADLKLESPATDQELRVNFIRFWKTVLAGSASWAHGTRHGPHDEVFYIPSGQLRFGGKDAVAVQLTRFGALERGDLDIEAKLRNLAAQPVKVRVEMGSNSGEIQDAKDLDVPSKGAASYTFKARVIKPETGEVIFKATDAKSGALLYAAGYPIIRKDHPEIYLRKYPSAQLVKFEVDFTSLAETPPAALAATVEIAPAGVTAPTTTIKANSFKDYAHTFELPTQALKPGAYEARFTFTAKGKKLDAVVFPFDVKPLPAWYDNRIGYDDPEKPPYPFTKMEVRNHAEVCVWGRAYRFSDSLLPAQIEINPGHYPPCAPYPGNGRPLLRRPMRLVGQAGEAAFSTDQLKTQGKWTSQTSIRVAGQRRVTAGNLAITADVELEYDGFCWVRLSLAPVQGSVKLQSLALEAWMTPEFSDTINAGEYSLVGTGDMPIQPLVKSAIQPVWLGNGDGGLQMFLETLAAFNVKDLQTTLQVMPGKEGVVMRYNLVDQPLELVRPHVIEFGFNATPVRPSEWRTPREQMLGRRASYFMWFTSADWIPGDPGWIKWRYWNGPQTTPDYTADRGGHWFSGQPYMTLDAVPIIDPDVQEFADEWLLSPETRWRDRTGKAGEMVQVCHHAKSYRDWVLWRMHELFKVTPFAGVYYDVTFPNPSSNPHAGAGLARPDGTRLATAPLRALRDTVKRIYVLCRHTYPDGQIMFHDSGIPHMAYMAFAEVFFDGENLNSSINAKAPTYRGVLTPGRFRAEYMGHNWGPQVWWLGQGRIAKETIQKYGADVLEDHLAGLMLLHDAPVIFAGGFSQWRSCEAERRTLDAIRRYELYGCGYRFMPYWRDALVTGLKANQYASFFVRQPLNIAQDYWSKFTRNETDDALPHRAIGIFCNESDWKGELAAKVDLKKLGFKDGARIKAVNAVHSTGYRVENVGTPQEKGVYFPKPEETAILKGDDLRFPMTEWNYRMIVLEETR